MSRFRDFRCVCHRLLLKASTGLGILECKCARCGRISTFNMASTGAN